jgi:FtsP/CotA-like multicopper oxidase with cupredoxin domain
MYRIHPLFALFTVLALTSVLSLAQQACPPRPVGGSTILDPLQLVSQNGQLTSDLTMVSSLDVDGTTDYCFLYSSSQEEPTLVANPGDMITLNLTNHLPATDAAMAHGMSSPSTPPDACAGGAMTASSTNIHFHGLNIPPKCHQDDVIKTDVEPNDPPFQYSFQLPANEPPGLYWYHPHPHGFTATQIVGGAAGALIVEGIEKVRPEVAGLTQRVLVIRQKAVPGGGDESSVLSINFVPDYENLAPVIMTKPLEQQFWRVVNASSLSFVQLQVEAHTVAKTLRLIALDGVPLSAVRNVKTVLIPPAGRAEFIIEGPPANQNEQFLDLGYDTGPTGDSNPVALLANIVASNSASVTLPRIPAPTKRETVKRFAGLSSQTPAKTRKLYFSENSDGTQFFITVAGQTPKLYDPYDPPAIVTQQGTVEDWIIENHSTEVHAFHIHQIHFIELEQNGVPTHDSALRDTVVVPYWDGVSTQYPSIKVRMDFRDPEIVGTFLYHCHILDHEDGGMMAKIKVLPAN